MQARIQGRAFGETILDELGTLGISTEYLRGQGYHGAAAMSGHLNGVQTAINS